LNGHLILREHKTGVHYLHEQITKRICSDENEFKTSVAYFDHNSKYSQFLNMTENRWMINHVNVCTKAPRILSYFFPIEIFFGKNDIYFCDGLFPITFFKSKRICLVNDLMVNIYPQNYTFIKKMYLKYFFRHLRRASKVVCISNNTKQDIIKYYGIPEKNITVCYDGVNEEPKFTSIFENKNIKPDEKFFLYIGDMRKNKNLPNTVRGFIRFCEENSNSNLYFYIAGKQNEEYETVKKIADTSKYSSRIKFLGYISENDKCYLYEHTSALVLLSFYEGFGMPIVEAMQYKRPIITSNCSSMLEIGKDAAILVNPFDISGIAKSMGIISNGYSINQSIYEEKLKLYSFDNVANIIQNEIKKLLDE